MKLILIRHGEPDYTPCYERGFIGHGRDLAALTPEGVRQAIAVSEHPSLKGGEIIISSPYTRALQTAAIISKSTGLDIAVELDLHEFLPDKTFQYKGAEESAMLHKDFMKYSGEYPNGEERKWETVSEIIKRVSSVMTKYEKYQKVIVVAHGGVIRRFIGKPDIAHCVPYEAEYDSNFAFFGYV